MRTRLLTLPEVAELLRTPQATLRYWRHLGAGPKSFRIGRRVVYREEDLVTWLDEQARVSGRRNATTVWTTAGGRRCAPRDAG